MITVPLVEKKFPVWCLPVSFDDAVDRLNYFYTTSLLFFFALVVSAKQYVGSPIQCWTPKEFSGGWEQYAEDYCFIQNTFFVPLRQEIPRKIDDRKEAQIGYYQWVPIVLLLQAFFFYLPSWLWTNFHKISGLDLRTEMEDAAKIRNMTGEERKNEIDKLSSRLEERLEVMEKHRTPLRICCFHVGSGLGAYISVLHLFIKFLYVFNIVVQFYMLNRFLGMSNSPWSWGLETSIDLYSGREWMDSGSFPRVTLCDFEIRQVGGNFHRYTVQCVLMMNVFNEKIYLFLWYWFLFIMMATVIDFIYSTFDITLVPMRESSVRYWLMSTIRKNEANEEKLHVGKFCRNALKSDGVLCLRFMERHAGGNVARDVASKMYDNYVARITKSPPSTMVTSLAEQDMPNKQYELNISGYHNKLI